MTVQLIVAVAHNRAIGFKGNIPWKIPSDLKRFKKITSGNAIIMGRKTFESLPGLLPKRKHIVITRNSNHVKTVSKDVDIVSTLEEAITKGKVCEHQFIIGGAQIYDLAWPCVEAVHFTRVNALIEQADTFFTYPDATYKFSCQDFQNFYEPGDQYACQYFYLVSDSHTKAQSLRAHIIGSI